MMFGLPGAALAMYHSVPKERRAKFAGLFLGVALTSFVTGITEPLEFMFLFVAPILYVIHAFLDGLSFAVADLLNIRIGNTFSGGLIDYLLFGVLQGNSRTHWLLVIPVGLVWFALYYFIFRWYIHRFNIATPGRLAEGEESKESADSKTDAADPAEDEANEESDEEPLYRDSRKIIAALGGEDNLEDVDACITRLRVSVKDPAKVDKPGLISLGAADVFNVSGGVQAVYGAKAILYKDAIHDILGIEE